MASDIEQLTELRTAIERVRREIAKVIIGQERIIEQVLIALFARGHCLLVGVPGLPKRSLYEQLPIRSLSHSPASSSHPT